MANHEKYSDRESLTYRNVNDGREMRVYEGTGSHDALRTDPEWERLTGADKQATVAQKTEKVGRNDEAEIEALDTPELRQLAAQAGAENPEDLSREDALEIVRERAEQNPEGITLGTPPAEVQPDTKGTSTSDSGPGGDGKGETPELSDDLTRKELDKMATDAGVKEPMKLPNKQAVVRAIEKARKG